MNAPKPEQVKHTMPVGAVVIYFGGDEDEADDGQRRQLIVVEHQRDVDGTPLYLLAEKAIAPPPPAFKLFSLGYIMWRFYVGGIIGGTNGLRCYDTNRRVPVTPFLEMEEARRDAELLPLTMGDIAAAHRAGAFK